MFNKKLKKLNKNIAAKLAWKMGLEKYPQGRVKEGTIALWNRRAYMIALFEKN